MLHIRNIKLRKVMPSSLLWRAITILVTPILALQLLLAIVYIKGDLQRQAENSASKLVTNIELLEQLADLDGINVHSHHALPNNIMSWNISPIDSSFHSDDSYSPAWWAFRLLAIEDALQKTLPQPNKVWFSLEGQQTNIITQHKKGIWLIEIDTKTILSSKWHFLIVHSLIGSFVFVALAVLFLSNQVRPIIRLARGAEIFKRSGKPTPIKVRGAREVRRATEAFNEMQESIAQLLKTRTAMLTSVSHDLRTPLTRLRLEMAMLPESIDTQGMIRDIEDMEDTIGTYIDYIRDNSQEQKEDLSLGELLFDIVSPFETKHSINLHLSQPEQKIKVRPNAMRRCLTNIVQNACDHAEHIFISDKWSKNELTIIFEDDGPGIPEEKRDEALTPFNRAGKTSKTLYGTSGLGLSISRDTVIIHGGELTLGNSRYGGLSVAVTLPLHPHE
ncbi:MAG: HAMP domain-containing protein [Alphaproteobacteria bacterium]|nr:HAMP domain-containing protein [Alphaproteobacteria bacterium]